VTQTANIKYFNSCSGGKADAVAAFLDAGIDPEARDKYGLTGLIWAGRKGRLEIADLLLARGAGLETGDNRGRTALYHAVTYQRYDFVRHLAALGANLNPVDSHGWTPLDFSQTSHHRKMSSLLVELGGVSAGERARRRAERQELD
jgi:uncharacterized protein